jgi:hypothetical protein
MDDQLLRELIAAQKEQTELLRKHLGRIKFSLRTLLAVMTLLAVGLGIQAYRSSHSRLLPAPSAVAAYPIYSNPGAVQIQYAPTASSTYPPASQFQPLPYQPPDRAVIQPLVPSPSKK